MKEIQLSQSQVALVDDEDFEELNKYKWCADKIGYTWYAERVVISNKKRIKLKMHRVIINASKEKEVDHKDKNGLNNQKENLREATHSENQHNRGINVNNKSGYKGVYWKKISNKWFAAIGNHGKLIHLGYFSDKKEAALAYNEAAIKYHGTFANLNVIV